MVFDISSAERVNALVAFGVAELGSAFLSADLGIAPEVRDDHASYIASWLKVLQNETRFIFTAASHAQRAADYLHGLQGASSTKAFKGAVSA